MAATSICRTQAQSLWPEMAMSGVAVDVIRQVRTSLATVELHDVVFHGEAESEHVGDSALLDLSLSRRAGDPVGGFPDLRRPQRPIGEILFIPPQTRFQGRWRGGTQRTLWVVPADSKGWGDRNWSADALDDVLDIRSDELRAAMLRLARELARPGFASDLMVEALSTEVLVLFDRHLRAVSGRTDLAGSPIGLMHLRRVGELVDQVGPVPTLAELAGACGVSVRHFSRLFRQTTGQSAVGYIQNRRLERASDRLAHSGASVKQVAWEAGFESAAAFSTAFRRHTGHSPRQFRRSLRN